jgi:hypothetical protein
LFFEKLFYRKVEISFFHGVGGIVFESRLYT